MPENAGGLLRPGSGQAPAGRSADAPVLREVMRKLEEALRLSLELERKEGPHG